MLGTLVAFLAIVLLAAAIPLAIVVFTAIATRPADCGPTWQNRRWFAACVFGVSALLWSAWIFAGTGGTFLIIGLPAALLAAALGAAGQRFLSSPSRLRAAIAGMTIAILAAFGTTVLLTVAIVPDTGAALAVIGIASVLLAPYYLPTLSIGLGCGLLVHFFARRQPPATTAQVHR